jgi:hypothetical protein
MSELTVFVAAFLGSFTGMLAGFIPVIYYIKKKISSSPMGAMFG